MTGWLDHIMYGVRDLNAGMDEIEARTGVRPVFGGFHPGQGTCNAVMSLGNKQYLEIIAPDPEQGLGGTLGEALINQRGPGIRTWAVAVTDLEAVAAKLDDFGMAHHILEMGRTRDDGVQLKWRVLFPTEHQFGDALPFFIDWGDSPHPSEDAPGGCTLGRLRISVEAAADYREVMNALGLSVDVDDAGPGLMAATLDSPRGPVELLHFRAESGRIL